MEDEQSTDVEDNVQDAPAEDPILAELSDTEDSTEQSEVVEETQETEESEAETAPEGETTEEETEEVQTDVDAKEEARRRYEERQAAKAERQERITKQSQEYIQGSEDEYDQRLRAMEVGSYIQTIEANEQKLITEFERAKANPDLQIFNPDNKELFNQRAYDKAVRDYNAGYVQYDENNNIVGVKGSLYEHLTETADLLKDAVKVGAVQQVRATQKMRSTADTKPAATPKDTPKDTIMEILQSD